MRANRLYTRLLPSLSLETRESSRIRDVISIALREQFPVAVSRHYKMQGSPAAHFYTRLRYSTAKQLNTLVQGATKQAGTDASKLMQTTSRSLETGREPPVIFPPRRDMQRPPRSRYFALSLSDRAECLLPFVEMVRTE